MNEILLTPDDVAKQLGLHVRTVRRYLRDGELPAVKVGKRLRVPASALTRLADPTRDAEAPVVPVNSRSTAIVEIDAIGERETSSLLSHLHGAANAPRPEGDSLRIDSHQDPTTRRLRVVIFGEIGTTATVLGLIETYLQARRERDHA